MRLAVTGASGFVGARLCAALAAGGAQVVALRRADGDLGDPGVDWRARLAGADAVVHLAAIAHERAEALERSGDHAAFRRVNVEGSERLARQAAAAGVRHLVFASTIGVCGDETSGTPFTEASPYAPCSLYARSKQEAEERLARLRGQTPMRITILRPTLVYGPGNAGNFLRLLRLVRSGLPLPFGAIHNRRTLTYVDNLVSAIRAVLAYGGSETLFIACDSESLASGEIAARLAEGMGRRVVQLPVPAAWLRLAGAATGRRDVVRRLVGSLEADNRRLRHAAGWQPPVPARDGLRATAEWFARGAARRDRE